MEKTPEQFKKSQVILSTVEPHKNLDLINSIVNENCNLAMVEMNLTITNVLNKPTIRSVFKGKLGTVSFVVVNYLCTRFINSFAFATKLSQQEIEMLTVDTLDRFGYESLEDVILFFKMARSGKFGSAKKGIDSNLIFGEWYPMYMEMKATERERVYLEKKSKSISESVSIDSVKEKYLKFEQEKLLKYKIQKAIEYVDKVSENFDKQMLEDTILEWSKDPKKDYYTKLLKKKRRTIK